MSKHPKGIDIVIHELRIYTCVPNKLPQVISRFEAIILPLWKQHGIQPLGFWTTLVGPSNNDLTYMLEWESLAEREARWAAFVADPLWLTKKRESEQNGPLVSSISNRLLVKAL